MVVESLELKAGAGAILVWLSSFSAMAQPSTLFLKDGRKVNFNIKEFKNDLLTDGTKTADLSKIDSIAVSHKDPWHIYTYNRIKDAGIKLSFGDAVTDPIKVGERQYFNKWAGFSIYEGLIIWQAVYQRQGMSMDSIRQIVVRQIKHDLRFTMLTRDDNEYVFDVTDKPVPHDEFIYRGKMIVEFKDGKYRVTLKSIEMKGLDPQAALDDSQKYFREIKLPHMARLSTHLLEGFDFKGISKFDPVDNW